MPSSVQIIIDNITVNNLIDTSQTIDVSWHLSESVQGLEGYILSIMSAGKSVQNYTSDKENDTLVVPNGLLSAEKQYLLQMWYRTSTVTSSGSSPVPIIITAPTISSATWVPPTS